MKILAGELTDRALDWAVANCNGLLAFGYHSDGLQLWIKLSTGELELFAPSADRAQGQPIIDTKRIALLDRAGRGWGARIGDGPVFEAPTQLMAAMRCHVASELGSEIDVPDDLIQSQPDSANTRRDQPRGG